MEGHAFITKKSTLIIRVDIIIDGISKSVNVYEGNIAIISNETIFGKNN